MKFYIVHPEVPGEFGEHTIEIGEKADRPPKISKLHYEFNCWPQDDFLTYLCLFIGSDRFRQALELLSPPISGVEFDTVEVSGSPEFEIVWRNDRPGEDFGIWHWFKITGTPGIDDFGYRWRLGLVISERVLQALQKLNMKYCDVTEFDPERQTAESK